MGCRRWELNNMELKLSTQPSEESGARMTQPKETRRRERKVKMMMERAKTGGWQ